MKYEPKNHIQQYKCYRELDKARYIKDKSKRLEAINKILNDPEKNSPINGNTGALIEVEDLEDNPPQSFIYGDELNSERRILEVDLYIETILKNANNAQSEIDFLIDEKYKIHKNVLSVPKENELFQNEINDYIIDKIAERIREIDPETNNLITLEAARKTLAKKHGLTQGETAVLFHKLQEKGIFNPESIDPNDPQNKLKQAKFIAKITGLQGDINGSVLYKAWLNPARHKNPKTAQKIEEYFDLEND